MSTINLALMGIYVLKDVVAEQFGPTFEAINVSTAVRSVQMMKIKAYEDFELYRVGSFDRATGVLKVYEPERVDWITANYRKEMNPQDQELSVGMG